MKLTRVLGYTAGSLLIVSAFAHAFGGWPPLRTALNEAGVDGNLIGALGVGWHFGSVAMFTFGVIVVASVRRAGRREARALSDVGAIAAAYLFFGAAAFLLRNFNPHFLGFIVMGLLVAAYTILAARQV